MRVDVQYRQWKNYILIRHGNVFYVANWRGKVPERKRALLKAMMRDTVKFGPLWLWD